MHQEKKSGAQGEEGFAEWGHCTSRPRRRNSLADKLPAVVITLSTPQLQIFHPYLPLPSPPCKSCSPIDPRFPLSPAPAVVPCLPLLRAPQLCIRHPYC